MALLAIGDVAPDFTLPDDTGAPIARADYQGKQFVLYFYPKDDTPGCTTEAIDFTTHLADFRNAKTDIIGVSPDTPEKHAKFKNKHALGIKLLSDTETKMAQAYGVWVEKNMYGRKFMGIERSTFLIDDKGRIAHIWRKLRVKGHATAVLETVQNAQK